MKIKFLMSSVLLLTLAACGGGDKTDKTEESNTSAPETSETTSATSEATSEATSDVSSEAESVIKSLVANSDEAFIKLDDVVAANQFYTLTGVKTLTSKQKKVTLESDNTNAVVVKSSALQAVGLGEANITVTSTVDTTKSCTFKLIVKDVFFDRNTSSSFSSQDDFSKELIEDGGIIRTGSASTLDIFVKHAHTTMGYIEGKFTWNSTSDSEAYPKMGVVVSTLDNPVKDSTINSITDNRVVIFFNPEDCHNAGRAEAGFTAFGVCEVNNSGNWAWNAGVGNETARHCDHAYESEYPIKADGTTSFTMGVARIGLDFHVFINGAYRFSFTTLSDLFKTDEGTDALAAMGFFEFNTDMTVEEYSFTADETVINEKIPAEGSRVYIGTTSDPKWADD